MAFYTAVLLYEYALLYFMAVASITAFVLGGKKTGLTVLATGVFYAQELLLAIVIGALFARIVQYTFGPHDVPIVCEFIGGLGGTRLPAHSGDLLNPEQKHPKALEQVSAPGSISCYSKHVSIPILTSDHRNALLFFQDCQPKYAR